MTLSAIFAKPIDRPIEGVIKADDEASLRLEIEEYVLTNEVEKRLEAFLAAYTHYAGANGVWISGFFGSGKSHLLKMVAILLENRLVEGTPALDLFCPNVGTMRSYALTCSGLWRFLRRAFSSTSTRRQTSLARRKWMPCLRSL